MKTKSTRSFNKPKVLFDIESNEVLLKFKEDVIIISDNVEGFKEFIDYLEQMYTVVLRDFIKPLKGNNNE